MSPPLRLLLLSVAVLLGCQTAPTLDGARDALAAGDPERALATARAALARAERDDERAALRSVTVRAALAAGRMDQALQEYAAVQRQRGGQDPALLRAMAAAPLGYARASSAEVRRLAAVRAAALNPTAPRTAAALRASLSDRSPLVRAAAVTALAPVDAQALEDGRSDPSPRVRRAAWEAGTGLRPAPPADLLAAARSALEDPDPRVRRAVVEALRGAGPDADAALEGAIADGDDAVAAAAAEALAERAPDRALQAWAFSRPKPGPVGFAFGAGLALRADEPDPEALANARACLTDLAGDVRAATLRAMGPAAPARLAGLLRDLARRDPDAGVRRLALRRLAGAGLAAGLVADALRDPEPGLRLEALRARSLGAAPDFPGLRALLATDDPAIGGAVAARLLEEGSAVDRAAVWAAAEAPRARRAVLRWATAEASVEERPRLIALLDDPSLEVRRWAIEGLARVGEPADVDLLLPALETTRDDVDLAAAVAVLAIDARTEPASPGP